MIFYLGAPTPAWLGHLGVPLFVSFTQLRDRRRMPTAGTPWVLDSGAFTELERFGRFRDAPEAYAERVTAYAADIGRLDWAAPQDWPCAPPALAATGLTVAEHLERTVASYLTLRELSPLVVPALQGWTLEDYLACADLYAQAGVELERAPVIALGSIAPRQGAPEVVGIVRELAAGGLALHGLGVKTRGLLAYADQLASADSMAWSLDARYSPPLPGCTHRRCNYCWRYALRWRRLLLDRLARQAAQLDLFAA